ncbi:acetylesterase [Cephaloticoccus primus]|uniref:Acetylesterase n=1 Tax=Cephaloticoccus primus TaxID=1548207 RepID=A0A139SM67_9BACT|nr:alpha/beta fold hydrolase [Cephaloticoccus primus]KXU35580.1 acetylesterase [Cephaloticoccus primus]
MPLTQELLAELHNYQGRNPRPADFDAYWDAALRELDATDPQPELVPSKELSPRNSEAFDLWFTGVGGARVYARYLRPKNRAEGGADGKCPALLQFHGYAGSSQRFLSKLVYSGEGFCVAALDARGQGGRSEDNSTVRGTTYMGHIVRGIDDPDPRKLLFRQIFLDTAQLARVLMRFEEVDPERLGVIGCSQGGGLGLACAALEPRIKRAVIGAPFLCDYRRVWETDRAVDAYGELGHYFYNFDPKHERADQIFTRLGYVDCQHLAPRIKAQVQFYTGLMDTITPPHTQFAAYNKITSPKELVVYPATGHDVPFECDQSLQFLLGL